MRRVSTSAALLLTLTACSAGTSTSADPPGTSSPPAAVNGVVELATIGDGRALHAASATGSASVVATTTGVYVVTPDGSTSAITTGIDSPASRVEVSPDGRYAIVQGLDGAELWSLGADPELVEGYDDVTSAAFTTDGEGIVLSSPSRTDKATVGGGRQTIIAAEPGTELGIATMTPDAAAVAVPVVGGAADLITYTEEAGPLSADVVDEPGRSVVRAEFGERADQLVLEVASEDGFDSRLVAWQPAERRILWETAPEDFLPGSIWAAGADGRVLTVEGSTVRLIGGAGAVDREWDLADDRWVTAVTPTTTGYALALSDGTLVITTADAEPKPESVTIGERVVDLRPLAGSGGVITVDADGTVRSVSAEGDLFSEISSFRTGEVNDVSFAADGSIAVAYSDGNVALVDDAGTILQSLQHPEGNVDSLAVSSDGSRLITGVGERLAENAFDDTVSMWDLDEGVRVSRSGGEGESVIGCTFFLNTVAYGPDGDVFASTSHDFTVAVHDAGSGDVVTVLPAHVGTVLDLAFSPTDDRFVTTSEDGAVRVWSLTTFELVDEFVGPLGGYRSVSFMPDGDGLVVSDSTGALRIIDVDDGDELLAFEGLMSPTGPPAIAPDGSIVVAPVDGDDVGFWSAGTGELLFTTEGHRAPVTSAAFSSDGRTLATGSLDATVRTWSLVGG